MCSISHLNWLNKLVPFPLFNKIIIINLMVVVVKVSDLINLYKQISFINREEEQIQHSEDLNYIQYNVQDDMVQTSFSIFFINLDDC